MNLLSVDVVMVIGDGLGGRSWNDRSFDVRLIMDGMICWSALVVALKVGSSTFRNAIFRVSGKSCGKIRRCWVGSLLMVLYAQVGG